jgi:hypothetical protein
LLVLRIELANVAFDGGEFIRLRPNLEQAFVVEYGKDKNG